MFPPQQRDDEFQPSVVLEHDLSVDHSIFDSLQPITKSNKKRQRTTKSSSVVKLKQCDEGKKHNERKKSMHREIERQRRQEMATLYASLRDLLPLEYIKGKRSVSDHMHEAANYIKHMEKKIEELELRKDNLKNVAQNGRSNNFELPYYITVDCCCDGIEILINFGIKEGYGFALSRVLVELIHTGLDVVSCFSNKVNERFLYKIHAQVNPLVYIDLPELQQRLMNVMN